MISEEEGCRDRIAFNSLYLFSFRSINYEVNGEELYDSRVERPISSSLSGGLRFLTLFPVHAQKHPGGVASMTRDRGYPDWLVLSARLLAQPCRPGYNSTKYMFDHVPLWLCEDITACCYMYCYFRNTPDLTSLCFVLFMFWLSLFLFLTN